MKALLLLFLLSLTAFHEDRREPAGERYDRMDTTASAMFSASLEATCTGPWERADWCRPVWPAGKQRELLAALGAIGEHETHFAKRIGLGQCRAHECDGGLAAHYWQPHAGPFVPLELWKEMRGVEYEPTAAAAYGASRVLGAGLERCGSVAGAIAFYANSRCRWEGAALRLKSYERALRALTPRSASQGISLAASAPELALGG